ncbi:MAG: hypothetical protein E7163_01575 [Firmicutes bacterium]|nr:hypothetical protein [Bacillota bacterium]
MIEVKLKISNLIIVILVLLLIISTLLGVFKFLNNKNDDNATNNKNSVIKEDKSKKIISELKNNHEILEYENVNKEFTSLVFLENERFESYIIDAYTGEHLEFYDLIKKDKLQEYINKENELINLKYPKFIANVLINGNGTKIYYVKDKEVIIFYYDYKFDYDYNEPISLRIDYNEVKDYLNFSYELNETYENENGYNYNKEKKSVAITFDDGPSRKYNPLILEVLNDNKAHATFYMVGTMAVNCQKCVLDTYNSGNEVGSHTYGHINIKNSSVEEVNNSLNKFNDLYNKITGDNIKTIRPPYGAYDSENLNNIDKPLILWNLDTQDWRYRNVDHIVNYIKKNISDGSIILMHELYESSYESLKIILPWLYSQGYQIVSVSELAGLKGVELTGNKAYGSFK